MMETREIRNKQGECIGQLSYPKGTPESTWEYALAAYVEPESEPESPEEVDPTLWTRFLAWFRPSP